MIHLCLVVLLSWCLNSLCLLCSTLLHCLLLSVLALFLVFFFFFAPNSLVSFLCHAKLCFCKINQSSLKAASGFCFSSPPYVTEKEQIGNDDDDDDDVCESLCACMCVLLHAAFLSPAASLSHVHTFGMCTITLPIMISSTRRSSFLSSESLTS